MGNILSNPEKQRHLGSLIEFYNKEKQVTQQSDPVTAIYQSFEE
jgi:hypothetical protein